MAQELASLIDVNTLNALLVNEGTSFNEKYRILDANFGQDALEQYYK
jgi:hypothetical protein